MVYVLLQSGVPITASNSLPALCGLISVSADAVRMQLKRNKSYKSGENVIYPVGWIDSAKFGNRNAKLTNFGAKRKVFVADVGVSNHQTEHLPSKSGAKHWIEGDF